MHPDKFHNSILLDGATRISAFTGTAYTTLIDDILRAEYLLITDFDIKVFDESKRETDMQLA